MALLEAVESSQGRVNDLRHELEKARVALDRTDAVLATADEGLMKAESAIVTTKKCTPVGLIVLRKRRQGDSYDDL
jgi:hypothetical protein